MDLPSIEANISCCPIGTDETQITVDGSTNFTCPTGAEGSTCPIGIKRSIGPIGVKRSIGPIGVRGRIKSDKLCIFTIPPNTKNIVNLHFRNPISGNLVEIYEIERFYYTDDRRYVAINPSTNIRIMPKEDYITKLEYNKECSTKDVPTGVQIKIKFTNKYDFNKEDIMLYYDLE